MLTGGPTLIATEIPSDQAQKDSKNKKPEFPHTHIQTDFDFGFAKDWKLKSFTASEENGVAVIETHGICSQGTLTHTLQIDGAGKATIDYSFTAAKAITPRTLGLAFTLPDDFNTLAWRVDAYRNHFPEDDVRRPHGVALAVRPGSDGRPDRTDVRPDWDWADDQVLFGTMDFSSTKQNLRYAALMNGNNLAIEAVGTGAQSVRSFNYEGQTHFILGSSYGGPSSRWPAKHTARYRTPLKAGDTLSDTIRFAVGTLPQAISKQADEAYNRGEAQEQLVRKLQDRYLKSDGAIASKSIRRITNANEASMQQVEHSSDPLTAFSVTLQEILEGRFDSPVDPNSEILLAVGELPNGDWVAPSKSLLKALENLEYTFYPITDGYFYPGDGNIDPPSFKLTKNDTITQMVSLKISPISELEYSAHLQMYSSTWTDRRFKLKYQNKRWQIED